MDVAKGKRMDIEYRVGSLFDAVEPCIAHGCNARGRMGAGVAKEVRRIYPAAYEAYRDAFQRDGLRLGQVIDVDCGRHVVANAVTQLDYGNAPGVLYADYDAIERVVATLDEACAGGEGHWGRDGGVRAIAMPLIGAGLAAGSWKRISGIVEAGARHFRPVVYLNGQSVPTT